MHVIAQFAIVLIERVEGFNLGVIGDDSVGHGFGRLRHLMFSWLLSDQS